MTEMSVLSGTYWIYTSHILTTEIFLYSSCHFMIVQLSQVRLEISLSLWKYLQRLSKYFVVSCVMWYTLHSGCCKWKLAVTSVSPGHRTWTSLGSSLPLKYFSYFTDFPHINLTGPGNSSILEEVESRKSTSYQMQSLLIAGSKNVCTDSVGCP